MGLKKRRPEYERVIAAMPSFKAASYKGSCCRLAVRQVVDLSEAHVSQYNRDASCFDGEQGYMANDNWSKLDGIKGHAPRPVKGLKQELPKRAAVVFMDEFRTSKLCSLCHWTLSSVECLASTHSKKLWKKSTYEGVAVEATFWRCSRASFVMKDVWKLIEGQKKHSESV